MKLHLICNAHLDPVWLWEWEEGAASAISTFRSAANLAEEFDYIFCHNEAVLYEWIEQLEPQLFERICGLVKKGRWHIMGGWYLQPDCNMPSGESFVRQIMRGRSYFQKHFGKLPMTAVNFDPFGHSFGLPQILKKCGYNSYLCCRPSPSELNIPDDFVWEGVDGSIVDASRVSSHYNSALGHATDKIKAILEKDRDKKVSVVLWGVGNHGGGPSRKDLSDIENLQKDSNFEIVHSLPENYFKEREKAGFTVNGGLNTCMPGCYTSQVRIKQLHRELENALYSTEKMLSHAALATTTDYPHEKLKEAEKDLLTAEFHDILPGSGIKEIEDYGIRLLHHGLEVLNRLRAKAFFALMRGQKKAEEGEFPIIAYNPHPYAVKTVLDVGFNLEDQNFSDTFTDIVVCQGDEKLPSQVIKEKSNLNLDWMKRVLIECTLPPMSISRFDCKKQIFPQKPVINEQDRFIFDNGSIRAEISKSTGALKNVFYKDKKVFECDALLPLIFGDNEDPWAMSAKQLLQLGEFEQCYRLMEPAESSDFSGALKNSLPPVRMIENGAVCTVFESVFKVNHSSACIRYTFYKNREELDIDIDSVFTEKNKLVKLRFPFAFEGEIFNDIAFGKEQINNDGKEHCMHKYVSYYGEDCAVAILNSGIYGMSAKGRDVFITLVRGAAYSAHPIGNRDITPQDRYTRRMDQGERNYSLKLLFASTKNDLEELVDRSAVVFNEKPYSLCVFPSGEGEIPLQNIVEIQGESIVMPAFKQSEDGSYILRLHNNRDKENSGTLLLKNTAVKLHFKVFEVKTIKYRHNELFECDTMEI